MDPPLTCNFASMDRMSLKRKFCVAAMSLTTIALSSILVMDHSLKKIGYQERFNVQSPSCTTGCFDYNDFWQKAMHAAHNSLAAAEETINFSSLSEKCPKVYVYDLPWDAIDSNRHPTKYGSQVQLEKTSDKIFKGYLYKTNQYAFPSILEHRLRESGKCRTMDPHKADLFFVPVLTKPKGNGEWNATCQKISGKMIRNKLHHLNSTNACRHFFAIGKSHTDVTLCNGWFSNPIPELKPFLRLAYSSYSFVVDSNGAHDYDKKDATNTTYPNLYSVPYPSSLHFRSKKAVPHFTNTIRKRRTLMSFIGKDNHGDVPVRQRIHDMCDKYNNSRICNYQVKFDLVKDPTAKSKAVFCLEPAGDTPTRKSIADSITFGCIPVLFSELTDNVAPWFWLDWKDRARILVPRNEFVAGSIDLKTLLESIPKDFLALLQETLKEKARRFQYSIDDDPKDGVRILLENLHREASRREEQGTCGY